TTVGSRSDFIANISATSGNHSRTSISASSIPLAPASSTTREMPFAGMLLLRRRTAFASRLERFVRWEPDSGSMPPDDRLQPAADPLGRTKTVPTTPSVRRLTRNEWREYRALRLRALADSPTAFATTLAEARAREDADWLR